ncbi:MAG: hypothetical protein N2746_03680 [Deltaproteobacteria bacterium]|nr:hypothetical protein [Deltaproteobacteria bacterium]
MRKDPGLVVIICIAVLISLFSVKCSSSSDSDNGGSEDAQIDPISKVCSNLPKCFGGSYPAFFGKSKKDCMTKINENLTEDEVDMLIEAGTKCDEITPIITNYEGKRTCEILKGCIGDAEFRNMFGTIEGCITYGKDKGIKEEDFKCVDNNTANCDVVANYCLGKYAPDAGVEDAIGDGGTEMVCITETNTYYCKDVCEKFRSCTGEYCPQGGCTKEECINGCESKSGFTVELMCCLMEKPCSEIQTCIPQ